MVTATIQSLKERLNHSFFGPLTLAFVLLNWRIVLHVFSNEPASVVIKYSEENFNSSTFICAFFFAVIYIILSEITSGATTWGKTKLNTYMRRINNLAILENKLAYTFDGQYKEHLGKLLSLVETHSKALEYGEAVKVINDSGRSQLDYAKQNAEVSENISQMVKKLRTYADSL